MDSNVYTTSEGEVILTCSKMCDEFERYLNDINRISWTTERANRLFNIFMQRKFKDFRGWHNGVVKYVSAYVQLKEFIGFIELRLTVKLEFSGQDDECFIEPVFRYDKKPLA